MPRDFEVDPANRRCVRCEVERPAGHAGDVPEHRLVDGAPEANRVDDDPVVPGPPGLRLREGVAALLVRAARVLPVRQEDDHAGPRRVAVPEEFVHRDLQRRPVVRAPTRIDCVDVRLRFLEVREAVVGDRGQVVLGTPDVLLRQVRVVIEVDDGDMVRALEAADVFLRPREPELLGIILVHRPGAVDCEDDVLVKWGTNWKRTLAPPELESNASVPVLGAWRGETPWVPRGIGTVVAGMIVFGPVAKTGPCESPRICSKLVIAVSVVAHSASFCWRGRMSTRAMDMKRRMTSRDIIVATVDATPESSLLRLRTISSD